MGAHLKTEYVLKNSDGIVVFEGTSTRISNFLRIDKTKFLNAYYSTGWINGYQILSIFENNELKENNVSKQNHLFNEDGSRRYYYRKGYPNRYKDSHCVRFTPL